MQTLVSLFESLLWKSRFVVVVAVVASLAAALAIFFVATVDVVILLGHVVHYADGGLQPEAREALRQEALTHIVEVVDGYLLALVMLIFSLGMYELFVSDIDVAKADRFASRVLVIRNLDDLKNRLAKVILMILIVSLFQHAIKMPVATPTDLVALAVSIALVGVAFRLSHSADSSEHAKHGDGAPPER